jgi:hypothetical protein
MEMFIHGEIINTDNLELHPAISAFEKRNPN